MKIRGCHYQDVTALERALPLSLVALANQVMTENLCRWHDKITKLYCSGTRISRAVPKFEWG